MHGAIKAAEGPKHPMDLFKKMFVPKKSKIDEYFMNALTAVLGIATGALFNTCK
jgi:hypothetical protein